MRPFSGSRRWLLGLGLLWIAITSTACTKLFGGLRRDFDDQQSQQYTAGGRWPEHGWLDEGMPVSGDAARYNSVGHSERAIASEGVRTSEPGGWVSAADQTASQRDALRGANGEGTPSFSSAPNLGPATRRQYKNGRRATRDDFVDDSQNEGSLWASDGQTNYYFTKNRIRGIGDIVTVKMEADLVKDLGAEIKRTLTETEKSVEIQAASDRITGATGAQAANSNSAAGGSAAPVAANGGTAPASLFGGNLFQSAAEKDIDLSKSLEAKEGDPIMAEILDRYPNGNYKIRGTKRIMYKNGAPRLLTLVGVVRGQDIAEDDTVPSGKLYEYRLEAYR